MSGVLAIKSLFKLNLLIIDIDCYKNHNTIIKLIPKQVSFCKNCIVIITSFVSLELPEKFFDVKCSVN
jgi:hypothetical protein